MAKATEIGYLKIPEGVLIDIELINRYPDNQLVIITTGSQGEPMSALTRMALGGSPEGQRHPKRLHHYFRQPHSRQREGHLPGDQRADEAGG